MLLIMHQLNSRSDFDFCQYVLYLPLLGEIPETLGVASLVQSNEQSPVQVLGMSLITTYTCGRENDIKGHH